MDDDEEMKTQCFGGDYMGEVINAHFFILLCIDFTNLENSIFFSHLTGVWSYVEAYELQEAETVVERLHAVLHTARRGGQFSCKES